MAQKMRRCTPKINASITVSTSRGDAHVPQLNTPVRSARLLLRGGVGRRVISGDVGDEVRARPPHRGSPRAEVGLALRLGENGRRRVCRRRGVIRPGRDSDVMSGDRGPRVTVAVESDDVGAGCSCPASHSLPAVGGVGAGALDGGSR